MPTVKYEPRPRCYPIGKSGVACIPENAVNVRKTATWWQYATQKSDGTLLWEDAPITRQIHPKYYIPIFTPVDPRKTHHAIFIAGVLCIIIACIIRFWALASIPNYMSYLLTTLISLDDAGWVVILTVLFTIIIITWLGIGKLSTRTKVHQ